MGFPSRTIGFASRTIGFSSCTMDFSSRTMDFASRTIDFPSRTMDFPSRTMSFTIANNPIILFDESIFGRVLQILHISDIFKISDTCLQNLQIQVVLSRRPRGYSIVELGVKRRVLKTVDLRHGVDGALFFFLEIQNTRHT